MSEDGMTEGRKGMGVEEGREKGEGWRGKERGCTLFLLERIPAGAHGSGVTGPKIAFLH